ncbi:hypothetical protein T484DRAFT_1789262, partial [Baffinella frigidus]
MRGEGGDAAFAVARLPTERPVAFKPRERQPSQVPIHGRRTGVLVPPVSKDAHGMEDLEEFFASPAGTGAASRKPARRAGARAANTLLGRRDLDVIKDSNGLEDVSVFWTANSDGDVSSRASIGMAGYASSSEKSNVSSAEKLMHFRANSQAVLDTPPGTASLFGSTVSSIYADPVATPSWETLRSGFADPDLRDDLSEAFSQVSAASSTESINAMAKARLASLVWRQLVQLLRQRFVPTVRASLCHLVRSELGALVKKELQSLSQRVAAQGDLSDGEGASDMSTWTSDASSDEGGYSAGEGESFESGGPSL